MPGFFTKFLESANFWRFLVLIASIGYILGLFIYSLSGIWSPFMAGFIGAYLLSGIVAKLERYKIPRGLGSGIIILSLVIVLVIIGMVALPYLQKELISFGQSLPSLSQKVYQALSPFLSSLTAHKIGDVDLSTFNVELGQSLGFITQWVVQFLVNLLGNGMVVANLVSFMILTPLIMFYLLKDWPLLISFLDHSLPEKRGDTIRQIVKKIDQTLRAYARGQALICGLLMILYAIGLSWVGLEQAIFIGFLTGFLSFIPYVGMLVGLLVSLSVAFGQFADWYSIGLTLIVYLTIHLAEGNLLTPYFIGEKVGLHPIWILFALLAGGTWFGFVGVLLAIPLAAVVGVLTRSLFDWYHQTQSTPVQEVFVHG